MNSYEYDNLPWFMAAITQDGETEDWGRFQQHNMDTALELVKKVFPNAEKIIIRPWTPELPKGQIELPLKHFPFQEYLGSFKRVRKALVKASNEVRAWMQLPLKMHLRKLYKKPKVGFIWTRPDGKQFVCRDVRALVARVMDYDGHLLQGLLRSKF